MFNISPFLSEAFGNLKNSEFYKEPDKPCNTKANSSTSSKAVRPSGSKSNPILVSPRQVNFQCFDACVSFDHLCV
jgi:hypothetical protein